MTTLEYWIGSVIVASVRRDWKEHWQTPEHPVRWYHTRKGGFRSLLFRLNSWAYHQRKEEQRREIYRLTCGQTSTRSVI